MSRALSTAEQLRAEAERLLARALEVEGMGEREARAAAEAEQALKGCKHVGPCNCGQPCGCGRPGCVIPLNKRRHARYRNNACKQYAFEQRHPEAVTQTAAEDLSQQFWGGVSARTGGRLGKRPASRGPAAKPAPRPPAEPVVQMPEGASLTPSPVRLVMPGAHRKRREASARNARDGKPPE